MTFRPIDDSAYQSDDAAGGLPVLIVENARDTAQARPISHASLGSLVGGEAVLPFSSTASDDWTTVAGRWLRPLPGRTSIRVRILYRATLAGAAAGTEAVELRAVAASAISPTQSADVTAAPDFGELDLTLDVSALPATEPLVLEIQARSIRGDEFGTLTVHHSDDDRILGSSYSSAPTVGAFHVELLPNDPELGSVAYHCTTTSAAPAGALWDYSHTVFPAPGRPRGRWPYNGDKAMTATLYHVGALALVSVDMAQLSDGTRRLLPEPPPLLALASGQAARGNAGLELVESALAGVFRVRGESVLSEPVAGGYARGFACAGAVTNQIIAWGELHVSASSAELEAAILFTPRADIATDVEFSLTAADITGGAGPAQIAREYRIPAGFVNAADDSGTGSRLAAALAEAGASGLSARTSRDGASPGELARLPRAFLRLPLDVFSAGDILTIALSVTTTASILGPVVHVSEVVR